MGQLYNLFLSQTGQLFAKNGEERFYRTNFEEKSARNIYENLSTAMVFLQIGNLKTHGEQGLEVSKDKVGGEDEYFSHGFDVTRLGGENVKIFLDAAKNTGGESTNYCVQNNSFLLCKSRISTFRKL